MSASEAPTTLTNPGTALYPGDFALVYAVSNYGQTADPSATPPVEGETMERVANVADDITASPDISDAESELKEQATTQRTGTHRSFDLEMNVRAAPQRPNYGVLGFTDAEGFVDVVGEVQQCIRVYVYRNDPAGGSNADAVLAEVKEYFGCEPRLGDDTLPNEDHANTDLVFYVNGDPVSNGLPMRIVPVPA